MKKADLGDVFEWRGTITEVTHINEGSRAIGFTTRGSKDCPHCGNPIDEHWDVIEGSPMFQEGAKPVKTISE